MIPIRDSQWRRSTPYVTRALIILNIFVFLAMLAMNDDVRSGVLIADGDALAESRLGARTVYPSSPRDDFTLRFGAVPEFITGYLDGNDRSHDVTEDFRITAQGQVATGNGIDLLDGLLLLLTPLTAMFIHAIGSSIISFHLIGNMLFLWVFADNVEDRLGHWRFLLFYFVTGYAAAAAHIWIDSGDLLPMIGASGAISGVLGAYLILFPRAKVLVLIPLLFFIPAVIPAPLMIGLWFVLNLIPGIGSVVAESTGSSGGTAWFAHIGGFIAGAILIYPFLTGRWRAPVGEIGPTWNLPPGLPHPFRRRRLTPVETEERGGEQSAQPAKVIRLARWRAIRRRRAGGVDAYRRPPPRHRPP